jgi:putative CocE/NonD family hydrolase
MPRALSRAASGVGPFDQRPIAERADVLSYTTPVLSQMVISGPVTASISLILDQPDTDIVLRLCDVYPDGRIMLMMEGHARVAAALGNYTHAAPAIPGNMYTIDVDMGHISLAINSGHRLSLLLTASNYPKLLVNPNDGSAPLSDHHDPRPVTISISDESFVQLYVQPVDDVVHLP